MMNTRLGTIRFGMTLVEVLIALAITLIILLSMTQAFTAASREIGIGRNRLLVSERIRDAADLVRDDLERLSLRVRPQMSSVEGAGYLEIVDRGYRDMTYLNTASNLMGDIDDIIAFTATSPGRPFKGRFNGRMIESNEAEIIYFTRHTDSNGNGVVDYGDQIRLYRRVLLIRPDLTGNCVSTVQGTNVVVDSVLAYNQFVTANGLDPALLNRSPYAKFLQFNDVSLARNFDNPIVTMSGGPIPSIFRYQCNSLGTLNHPKNRTSHLSTDGTVLGSGQLNVAGFPHPMLVQGFTAAQRAQNVVLEDLILFGTMSGSDVVLENVVGFDVRVFDPTIPVLQYAGMPLLPHDPGYNAAFADIANYPRQGFGAFVDLGAFEYRLVDGSPGAGNALGAIFPGQPYQFAHWRRRLVDAPYATFVAEQPGNGYWASVMTAYENFAGGPTYTTWTGDFERDGFDNDGDTFFDEGTDGVPDGNTVDGLRNDHDSAPPYGHPVTSVQITLRSASFDADRQQVRGSDQVMQSEVTVSTINQ
ncbi:MAG: hypothetical protein JNL67_22265 [Planctomycetaceae bacterium]|nr:hypothetical protein [Planctomycetaceae bacterium]